MRTGSALFLPTLPTSADLVKPWILGVAVAPTLGLAITRRGRNQSRLPSALKHLHTQEEKGKKEREKKTKTKLIQLPSCRPFLDLGKAR